MWGGFELLFTNLSMPMENVLLIFNFLAGLAFVAKDFRLGLVYYLVSSSGLFLWFLNLSQNGYDVNWSFALTFFFLVLAIMALNLFNIRRNAEVVI